MGLLDDAIREHLDLKRQRGADPGEVERLEREALGPVRREPTGRGMGAVPHLEVNPALEHDYEPSTELHEYAAPAQAPKRGFLRRHRQPSMPAPAPSDFAGDLDAGRHEDTGESHGDRFGHPDPFGQDAFDHDDPFRDDEPLSLDDSLPDDQPLSHEPATHEHAAPAAAAEPPPARPVVPAVGPEGSRPIVDSLPPRPSFAPVPPGIPGSEPEPAPADAVAFEPAADGPAEVAGGPPAGAEGPTTAAEPAPAEPALDERARADTARETREWSVEEVFAAEDSEPAAPEADSAEEDVLEETPELLQDTPDHDRLWFEQRPPRDFDFDG